MWLSQKVILSHQGTPFKVTIHSENADSEIAGSVVAPEQDEKSSSGPRMIDILLSSCLSRPGVGKPY